MTAMRWRVLVGVAALGLSPIVGACTGPGAGVLPSGNVTTAVQGWEHWFRLEWAPQPTPSGANIDGYIYNNYGETAANVQILAQGLDGAGNLIGQKIEWVPGTVPGMNRALFRVAGLPPAQQYRVSVWAFDFVQSSSAPQR